MIVMVVLVLSLWLAMVAIVMVTVMMVVAVTTVTALKLTAHISNSPAGKLRAYVNTCVGLRPSALSATGAACMAGIGLLFWGIRPDRVRRSWAPIARSL